MASRIVLSACLLSALALAGCVTPEEQTLADIEAAKAECVQLGYETGSSAHSQCTEAGLRERRAQRGQRAEALAALGRSMQQLDAPPPPQPITNCTTRYSYGVARTTCF